MRDNSESLEELGRRVAEAHTYLRIDHAREEMTQLESVSYTHLTLPTKA